MHAGLFDVLHDAADQDSLTVANAIDIDFGRQIEKPVQQHRAVVGHIDRGIHVSARSSSLCTTSMARPPSTYDGRTTSG